MVKNFIFPRWYIDMLIKRWENSRQVTVVEIASDEVDTVWAGCLLPVYMVCDHVDCFRVVSIGRNINNIGSYLCVRVLVCVCV